MDVAALQKATALFGGAIEALLPRDFVDASNIRPVPDNQEVFVDSSSDVSIVFEVMEHAPQAGNVAADFYFRDLADLNDARAVCLQKSTSLGHEAVPLLPSDAAATLAVGQQSFSKCKDGDDTTTTVHIILGVVQLERVQADLVISLNMPGARDAGCEAASAVFDRLLRSLCIQDWSLFGTIEEHTEGL